MAEARGGRRGGAWQLKRGVGDLRLWVKKEYPKIPIDKKKKIKTRGPKAGFSF